MGGLAKQASYDGIHDIGDGTFRAVISTQDPGVPNRLDKADFPRGIIPMRFYLANDHPEATVTKMPVTTVRSRLASDTPVVTPAEGREQLLARRKGAQLRRIWRRDL